MSSGAMAHNPVIDPNEVHKQAVLLQEEHAAHERGLGNEAGARRAEDLADRARERLRQLETRQPAQ
jgi:hypothetical protein